MFKNIKIFFILSFILLMPLFVNAQELNPHTSESVRVNPYQNLIENDSEIKASEVVSDNVFKARVIEVLVEEEKNSSGNQIIQQDLKLIGLEGKYQGQEFIFKGIGELEIRQEESILERYRL